jgi:tetratricopeptide (TPR) repeat protein
MNRLIIEEDKLYIQTSLLIRLKAQLKLLSKVSVKYSSMDAISAAVSKYYNEVLIKENEQLHIQFDVIGLGASNIERALKGKKGKSKVNEDFKVKYSLIDFLCHYCWKTSLIQTIVDSNLNWGTDTLYYVELPDYAKMEIEVYLTNSREQDKIYINKEIKKDLIQTDKLNLEIKTSNINFESTNYNILVLPFYNPEAGVKESTLGIEIKRRLESINELNSLGLNVKYFYNDMFNYSPTMAREIGKKIQNTNMVIWGIDSKLNDLPHQIYFHYLILDEILTNNLIPLEGKIDKIETYRIYELTEGQKHLEIEDVIYWFIGNRYYTIKDYLNALINFKRIIKDKYQNDILFYTIAECCDNLDILDEAKEYYEKAIEINHRNIQVLNDFAIFLKLKLKDIDGAKNYYERALAIDPKVSFLNYNYALLLNNNLKDTEGAKKYLELALESDPNYVSAHYGYATLLRKKFKDIDGAKEHYKKAFELDPNHYRALNNYATLIKRNKNNKEEARKYYEKAIQIKPNNAIAYYNYANLLRQSYNDLEAAKYHYLTAIKYKSTIKTKARDKRFGVI